MTIFLVRHCDAADRHHWQDDDQRRPLTESGQQQAVLLAAAFDPVGVVLVMSSPYRRCIQTVAPLARRKGLEIVPSQALAEGAAFPGVLDLLSAVPDGTVICSHGDVIPDTIAALCRRGMEVRSAEDWRTGSTWVLERNGDGFITATSWAPPLPDR